jgi:hypothetical protein
VKGHNGVAPPHKAIPASYLCGGGKETAWLLGRLLFQQRRIWNRPPSEGEQVQAQQLVQKVLNKHQQNKHQQTPPVQNLSFWI